MHWLAYHWTYHVLVTSPWPYQPSVHLVQGRSMQALGCRTEILCHLLPAKGTEGRVEELSGGIEDHPKRYLDHLTSPTAAAALVIRRLLEGRILLHLCTRSVKLLGRSKRCLTCMQLLKLSDFDKSSRLLHSKSRDCLVWACRTFLRSVPILLSMSRPYIETLQLEIQT